MYIHVYAYLYIYTPTPVTKKDMLTPGELGVFIRPQISPHSRPPLFLLLWNLELRGLEFRVKVSWFRVQGLGSGVAGS